MKRTGMKKKLCAILSIFPAVFLAVSCAVDGNGDLFEAKPVDGTPVLFDEGMGFYNTETSVLTDGGTRYVIDRVNSDSSGGKLLSVARTRCNRRGSGFTAKRIPF